MDLTSGWIRRSDVSNLAMESLPCLIRRGALRPGDRLPLQSQLVTRMVSSQTAAREAWPARGVIYIRPVLGAFVESLTRKWALRLYEPIFKESRCSAYGEEVNMIQRCRLYGLFFFVVFLFVPSLLQAQAVGQIWGAARDPSGAVIPHGNITAVEQSTGLKYSTVTTGSGNYSLTHLPIGTYTLTGGAPGFKVATITGVILQVNQQREVNFTLALAASTQRVTVSAAPPLLNTSNGTLGGVISGQQVQTLPLNGRDITRLVELEPGTVADPNGPSVLNVTGSSGFVSSNGTRGFTSVTYLDGSNVTNTEYGGAMMTNFNLDAMSEFRVLQNDYSAQYGSGGGDVILLASKAGTNEFHGSAFEFVRNSAFDARSFFASAVPPLQRNEFGGDIGGPIIKNKTFFFFDYAGFRQLSGAPNFYLFPSAANRNGVVNITGANGAPDQLLVPVTPAAKTVLDGYPLPNDPTGPYGPNTYLSALKTPFNSNQYSGRVDHRFSDKDSMFGRFTYDNMGEPITGLELATINPSWSQGLFYDARNLTVSEVHIFTPTLTNTLGLTWMRTINEDAPATATNFAAVTTNDSSLAGWGPSVYGWSGNPDTGILNDAVSWVKGRNMINAGFEIRDTHAPQTGFSTGYANGDYTFGAGTPLPVSIPSASGLNNLAAGSPSPSGLVSLMVGAPVSLTEALAFPGLGGLENGLGAVYQLRYWNYAGWLQDDITLTSKLTLNLGLRYEYNSVPTEEHGKLTAVVDDSQLDGGKLYRDLVLNPSPLWQPDYVADDFGPRLGLAYRLSPKTVLRGGFGTFTGLPIAQSSQQSGAIFPWAASQTIKTSTFPSVAPVRAGTPPDLVSLSGVTIPPSGNTNLIAPNTPLNLAPQLAFYGAPIELNAISMSLRNGYMINGNVAVERQLPGDMALSIAYVASNGVALQGSSFPNAYDGALPQYTPYTDANPGLGEFQVIDNHEHSTYNALEVELRKTSARYGLTFQASYTYSKLLDNGDNSGLNDSLTQQDPFCWRCDKSPGNIDTPQNFVMDVIYSLPVANWQALSHLPTQLTHGWEFAGIESSQSGTPFTIFSPYPVAAYGTDTYYGTIPTRPDLVGNATLNSPSNYNSTLMYFTSGVVQDGTTLNQQVFATPGGKATGFQSHPGSLGMDTFFYPLQNDLDFSVIKDTNITESKTLQFRAEFFNIFNLHAFNSVGYTLGASGFGLFSGSNPGRIIQFGLRFTF
jgi:Carboxypeptidase regulatory-like domain/TonB dependent receptor